MEELNEKLSLMANQIKSLKRDLADGDSTAARNALSTR